MGHKRKNTGSPYSDWPNAIRGIPQRFILGPQLFNNFINVFLFIEKSGICKFADDNILFSCGDNLSVVLKSLEHNMKILLSLDSLIANPETFQFMSLQKFLRSKYCLTMGSINVEESDHVELLGITIDKHLDFKRHIEYLCWNANYKLHALRRMRKQIVVEKAKLLGNAFTDSQFNSAPLINGNLHKYSNH